jgi:hypothetical protein
MPRTRRAKPLYQRGPYALHPRPGRHYEIIWYDWGRKRERSTSARTSDLEAARIALDRLYLAEHGGGAACPTCGQAVDKGNQLISTIIADYMTGPASDRPSAPAIRTRLAHVTAYIATLRDPAVRARHVDEQWVARFRTWLLDAPYVVGKTAKKRSSATVENSVVQLAAAMTWAREPIAFKPIPLKDLTHSPAYRADIATIARMFRYAMKKKRRRSLLAFLRVAVCTWARPDAVMDASTAPKRGQWNSDARVFRLNPVGRRQTRKYRASVPIPDKAAWIFDAADGPLVPDALSKATWRRMARNLDLPGDGASGMRLIRRSIATIARKRLGEEHWIQGRIMLGHVQPTTSDIYAIADPAHLGRALEVTSTIIDEIETLAPGAFYRGFTAALSDENGSSTT